MNPSRTRRSRRLLPALATVAALAFSTITAPGAHAAEPATAVVSSFALKVTVAKDFPRVVRYQQRATGATIEGSDRDTRTVLLNGKPYEATATFRPGITSASWTLTFADLPGVEIDVRVDVTGGTLGFRVTAVRDSADFVVNTFEIPNHDLVSVEASQPGATTAFTKIDTDSTRNADRIAPVTADTPLEDAPVGATYAIVNTTQLAASIETNGTYDRPTGAARFDGQRFWHQAHRGADGQTRVSVWSGQWTVRGTGAPKQSELPWARVVITPDANGDKVVDWQDGAIAFRSIAYMPKGGDQVADRVIQHIPFNFSSLATHPFARTLDDVKRLSLATDGLGQYALLKGYAAEGHDSAHPDYANNYNTRAGGLTDLNTLLKRGKKWNADFGVHVNATEAYPEARNFSEKLVDPDSPGWNWLNQSYYIRQRDDLNSGALLERTRQLREQTQGNLDQLYWDVYYGFGWIPDSMNQALREQGWSISSEWAYSMERDSLWSHWATDRNYGGKTNKGINSTIVRFIRNDHKDVWNPDPLLGGSTIVEAEGWTGQNDWNALVTNVWTNQVPTKFLQHHKIMKWSQDNIDFTDGVSARMVDGQRQIWIANAKVADGGTYLLPWGPKGRNWPNRMYHYNPEGGTTTWTLPPQFRGHKLFTVYKLTDTGRQKVATVQPGKKNTITLTAEANTAYVLYPLFASSTADPNYGEGTPVKDPGFNDPTLSAWTTSGDVTGQVIGKGWHVAQLGAGDASLQQKITGLKAGQRYAASAWVQIAKGQTRPTSISVTGDGVKATNSITSSPVTNAEASNEKRATQFQRLRVIFTAPRDGSVSLAVAAGAGDATVQVDDVRVVATQEEAPSGDVIAQQDFESVDQGWLPFVSGPAQAGGDARTHLARLHAPYTQAGWNGKLVDDVLSGEWSLKAHEEHAGLVYRSWLGTIPFQPSHRYRVEFDYQNANAGAYQFVTGADQAAGPTVLTRHTFGEQRTTAHHSQEFVTGACGDTFVGLVRTDRGGAQSDFIMDNLKVTDLGASETPGACAVVNATIAGPGLVPGEATAVTTTFTNHEATAATNVKLSLTAPEGWGVQAQGATTFASVAPGATVTTTWLATAPADDADKTQNLQVSASYLVNGQPRTTSATVPATILPAGLIPQSRLSIAGVSDQEPTADGAAVAAIDGKTSTMWHSAWSQVEPDAPYPHWITIDLGDQYTVDGFDYQVRIGNGAIKDYEIYVSDSPTSWGDPVVKGSFTSTEDVQHVTVPATKGRYVTLRGLNAINGAAFAGAGEINVWGKRLNPVKLPLSKADFTATGADSYEPKQVPANVIDGSKATKWHSMWSQYTAPFPHWVTIDMGKAYTLDAISLTGRQDGNTNGNIKDAEVYVSDDGVTWTLAWKGTLKASAAEQMVTFDKPVTGRHVKVVGLNAHNGQPFASIAELDFFGA